MTVHQVIDRIITYYPSLQIAKLNVQKATLENAKVQAQLSWVLSGQTGYSRDVSFVGAETDKYELGAQISKELESGSSVSLSANYAEEDSEYAFSPSVANPSKTTGVNLDYRMPLSKGSDNPQYQFNQKKAATTLTLNQLEQETLRDDIAAQAIELYYALADIKLRIDNVSESIVRAKKLKRYVLRNKEIGITETIDLLQTDAQLKLLEANFLELSTLEKKQQINLNRLLGFSWDKEIKLVIREVDKNIAFDKDSLISKTLKYNFNLRKLSTQLQLAESEIDFLRDNKKDKVDLVLSVGARNRRGDTATGSLNETDTIGGVKLEYQNTLDKTGFDSERLQAQIERNRILKTIEMNRHDLEYEIYSLVAEIETSAKTLKGQQKRKTVEIEKLKDAYRRFNIGRTDTNQIIQFETDLLNADLAVRQKSLEIANKLTNLRLKSGEFWPSYNSGLKK